METFFVVLMALVVLGVGALALVAVRRLSVLTDDVATKDD
jgi:Tfp pilus assembly protein PilV